MDTLDGIERLAAEARKEKISVFGVADGVMARLSSAPARTFSFAAFDLSAGVFAAAASIIFYVGVNAWMHIVSPLTQFFAPLQEVSLW